MKGPLRNDDVLTGRSFIIMKGPLRNDDELTGRSFIIMITAALCLIGACGVLEPPQDPDETLRVLSLVPKELVTQEFFASVPDSGGAGTLIHLRYSLSLAERQAIQTGAIIEAVLSVSTGQVVVEGWVESSAEWRLLFNRTVSGLDPFDLWWRSGWTDPTSATPLLGSNNYVRLRVTPGSDFEGSILRVIEITPGLGVYQAPSGKLSTSGAITSWGGGLAILESGTIRLWNSQGEEQDQVVASNPPHSFCRLGDYYYGTTATEIRRVPVTGGTWRRLALLPWSNHGGVALTADSNDLYLIRYAAYENSAFPTLYKLSEAILVSTSSFHSAMKDSISLRRNSMPGGNAAGFAWWGNERLLVAPGHQEGEFGLVTFSRGGWFQDFIPLPFEHVGVKLAFLGDHLFVGSARPTLEALAWGHTHQPTPPQGQFIYRFP